MIPDTTTQPVHPDIITRFDRVDRNVMAIEASIRAVEWNGRQIEEETVSDLQRKIFLNLFLCAIVFGFTLISCLLEPGVLKFIITAGMFGCLYMGMRINQVTAVVFRGMG